MSAASGNYSHRVIGTIFLISFGIYLFLATATYTPFDPGWMHVSSDTREVSNASGIGGAWFADLLYGVIGWSALLLPLFMFLEAIQLWWPRSYLTPIFRYAAQFFILLTTSALLCFFWQVPGLSLANTSGGIIGYEIAQSLASFLTSFGAIFFLVIFWVVLWTLAFKIEWLKTGETLRAIPGYLQDLFYKNVPDDAEDFDLTVHKYKPTHAKQEGLEQAIVEHTALNLSELEEEAESLLQQENQKIRQLDGKIATQPKVSIKEPSSNQSLADLSSSIVQSGEVWRANSSVHDSTQEKVSLNDLSDDNYINTPRQQDVQTPVPVELKPEPKIVVTKTQESDLSDLIAEADRQLEAERASKAAQVVEKSHQASSPLDWNDDEIFDELLAAVPVDSKPAPPAPKIVPVQSIVEEEKPAQPVFKQQTQVPVQDNVGHLADFGDLDDVFNDDKDVPVTTSMPLQNTQASDAAFTGTHTPKELSKEEFIAEWQETAGKPQEFEWEDLDAPLTDSTGRPVSRAMQVVEHRKTLSRLPGLDLLDPVDPNKKVNFTAEQLSRLSELLELKLQDFNVKAQVIEAHPGPVVTRFELDLAPGVKASKVTNISRDLARSMSMASVRVVEVIPGKPYIGIEVPNSSREMVRLIELLETPAYRDPSALLSMAMGKDISGNPVLADLAKAPHMLVAGTTGSGKSVAVNSMLLSMLLKYTPQELRLIMIDPKQLELANYNDIPHLLTPVVTDMKDAVSALNWCVNEMERRYKLMSLLKIRKLADYNRKVEEAIANGEDLIDPTWKPGDSATQERAPRLTSLPLIVIVADEFADMIMQVGKKAEEMITRLAQKSRAAGIHLLLATQRPTVDVVTGLIKANIPTRAALRVNSKIDSRTILDAGGAEDLLGHGDMLFLGPGKIEPERVHGAFISDDEVNRICDAWRERGSPNYVDEILTPYDEDGSSNSGGDYDSGDGADRDMLYDQCVAFVLETRKASASSLQRKFSLGYNRAARIIDQMEENGIVSALGANGKRDIIV